jgi:hypothetical protein
MGFNSRLKVLIIVSILQSAPYIQTHKLVPQWHLVLIPWGYDGLNMKLTNAFSDSEIYSVRNCIYKLSVRLLPLLLSLVNCVLVTVRCFKNMIEIYTRNWKSLHHSRDMDTISSTNISTGSFLVAFCWQLNLNLLWDIKLKYICICYPKTFHDTSWSHKDTE